MTELLREMSQNIDASFAPVERLSHDSYIFTAVAEDMMAAEARC